MLVLCARAVLAQASTGEIHLAVKDPSGAPMQVSGRLQNQAAGIDRVFAYRKYLQILTQDT